MLEVIQIQAETVGLAFQQQLAATYALKSKSKRRTEFNRLKRALSSVRLVPSTFDVHYITWGVDRNGAEAIVITGEDQQPAKPARRTKRS